MKQKKKPKIIIGAIDFTPADVIIELKNSKNAREFIARPRIQERLAHNDKIDLTADEAHEFSQLVPDAAKDTEPGGSAFTTCSTIAEDGVEVKLITVVGAKKNSIEIRKRALERHVEILPPIMVNDAIEIKTPVSYICFDVKGHKTLLKNPGTVHKFMESHPEYVERLKDSLIDTIAGSDLFYLPGGITNTQKFGCDIFELALNRLIQNNVPFIFTPPTHGKITDREAALYRRALAATSVFAGNADEVRNTINAINRLYGKDNHLDKAGAIKQVQNMFGKRYRSGNTRFPIAAITNDYHNAHVIMPEKAGHSISAVIRPVKPLPHPPKIGTMLGAGDNTLAGLIKGLLKGFDPVTSMKIGMHFAQAVIGILPAQLANPTAVFDNSLKALGNPKSEGWDILAANQRRHSK